MKEIEIFKNIKALEVNDEYFIGAKGYKLYKCYYSRKREYIGKVRDFKYSLFSKLPLIRRLFRAELNNLYSLSDNSQLIIAKKGIFKKEVNEKDFTKKITIPRGSRPLNLCITPNSDIYFGEYFANIDKKPVNVYHSDDRGNTWKIVYTFTFGSINHIHGIFWDNYTQKIWYATGDRDNECIIGYTEDGFKTVVEVFKGGQEFRACNLFFYKDYIVFATDSQYNINEIKLFDRKSLKIETLTTIQGTAIKGGQVENISFISTTVEPSKVNKDKYTHLWISFDGKEWTDIYKVRKDILPSIFQFGSIEFPQYKSEISDKLIFSGRAVVKIGGNSVVLKLNKT